MKKLRSSNTILISHLLFFIFTYLVVALFQTEELPISVYGGVRRLLFAPVNCTPRSIEEFPRDFMSIYEKQHGGVILHILIAIYLFAAVAMVCDDYFVPALERICDALQLKHDVAGATFMAAGSSAPEFFTALIAVFFVKSDVGISTIVGSAVFNILFIVALCGIFGGLVVYLNWWPMFRDTVYYCITIAGLIAVIWDEKVHWYEALTFVLMYVLYIVIMYFNENLERCAMKLVPVASNRPEEGQEATPLIGDMDAFGNNENETETDTSSYNVIELRPANDEKNEDDEVHSPFDIPDTLFSRTVWLLLLPVSLLIFVTVPDSRRGGIFKKLYFVSFFMSIMWIAAMSYVMVWMVSIIGDIFDIPDTVMGMTFLAAGTSVPDALASVMAARDGYGDMAVSNTIGSNIFDILLCLGLPWLIQTGVVAPGSFVTINSSGMVFSAISLLSTVIILFIGVKLNKWKLNTLLGIVLLIVYGIFILVSCMYELNVFGELNDPPCPRTIF